MAKTVVELFEDQVHRSSVRTALRRYRDGAWEEISWKAWWEASERLAAGLIRSGVEKGECVCLLASTRLEWVVVDMALAMTGAVCVPLQTATSVEELRRVLRENDIETVVVEDPVQLGKAVEASGQDGTLRRAVCIDDNVLIERHDDRRLRDYLRADGVARPAEVEVESLDDVKERGRSALAEESRFVARRRRSVTADTVATIVYTAGVSDRPRGVVLSHGNLAAQVDALSALQLFTSDDVQLLFLPLAHVFARMMYLAGVGYGMTTVFARGGQRLVDDLSEVNPTLMASVPRVYERLRHEIIDRIESRPIRSRLLPLALEAGKAMSRRTRGGDQVGWFLRWEHRFFSQFLLEDVRQWLGGNMRFLISGGAPLSRDTAEFFFATGALLLEGYGLTETSGAVSFNMPDDFRFGSAGKPLPGVDVTIAEDGEVLVRGGTVMQRFVADESGGVRGVDDQGWLHTGDIGHFDRDGFLHLTDRKHNAIITSTGKHVVPMGIEEALNNDPLVAHSLLVGEARPFLVVLIALDPDGILDFVDDHQLDGHRPVRELCADPQISQHIQALIDEVNREHAAYERIRQHFIIPEFLSTQDGTLTPSGQLRRAAVRHRFRAEIDALYERRDRRK